MADSQELSPELALLYLAMESIDNRNLAGLQKLLSLIPIDAMNRESGDELLVKLLTKAWDSNVSSAIPLIFESWQRVYPAEETIPFYVQLFTLTNIDQKVLQFVMEALGSRGSSYMELMSYLIIDHSDQVGVACYRASSIYGGSVSIERLIELRNQADREDNTFVVNHLVELIRKRLAEYIDLESPEILDHSDMAVSSEKLDPFAPIPSWVLDFRVNPDGVAIDPSNDMALPTFEETRYLPPDSLIELPSDQTLAALLTSSESSRSSVQSDSKSMKRLVRALSKMTDDEKMIAYESALQKYMYIDVEHRDDEQLDQGSILFRLYGPSILSPYPLLDELRYGGSRMFLSTKYPDADDDGTVESGEWFTGFCDYYKCINLIRRRWHAVRIPVIAGGWQGCYCSFDCIRSALVEPNNGQEPDIATLELVNIVEQQLLNTGIQDRRDNGDILDLDL